MFRFLLTAGEYDLAAVGHLPRPTSRPARVAELVAERPTIQPTALAVHWNGQIQRRPRRPDGRTGWLLFPADVSDRLLRAYLRIRWEVERRGLADTQGGNPNS